jgi:intracellular sulfur oxidation DsrE/DsrF family protein
MWQKYEIGKDKKIKAPRSEEWATQNLWIASRGGRGNAGGDSSEPQGNFAWLATHGHILLACDRATRNYANTIARNFKLEQRAVYDEIKANLVPGFILAPTGVYAVLRAQEAGCAYIRST